jgi:hypothetical protein
MIKLFYIDPMSYNNLSEYDAAFVGSPPNNFDVYYYASNLLDVDFSNHVKVRKIFGYSGKAKIFSLFLYLTACFRLVFNIFLERPHIMHLQWAKVPLFDIFYVAFGKLFGSRIVYTKHNITPHVKVNFLTSLFERLLLILVDEVIVHSQFSKVKILDINKNISVTVIAHPYIFDNHVNTIINSKKIRNNNLSIRIGLLGRSLPYKGYSEFIDRLKNSHFKNIEIVITDPVLLNSIPDVYDSFLYSNPPTNQDFLNVMCSCDFVVVSHKEISASGLLMSALGCNLNVIYNEKTPEILEVASQHANTISLTQFFAFDNDNELLISLKNSGYIFHLPLYKRDVLSRRLFEFYRNIL